MNQHEFDSFRHFVSRDRLQAYFRQGRPLSDSVSKYLWNIMLCESLYPSLNMLEIGIRNAVHVGMSGRFGKRWFEGGQPPLNAFQKEAVGTALRQLHKRDKPATDGAVVAELSFGFWVSMFGSHLDRSWRGDLLKRTFPGAPTAARNVQNIRIRLTCLRRFRNRVFHHERILHCEPSQKHAACREVIGWLDRGLPPILDSIDRYPEVYASGLGRARAYMGPDGMRSRFQSK